MIHIVVQRAFLAVGLVALIGCATTQARIRQQSATAVPLPLSGLLAEQRVELSGLAWHGDRLVLLPQFPERYGDSIQGGARFTLRRSDVLASVDAAKRGTHATLGAAEQIRLIAPGLKDQLQGFRWEGFEAIAIRGRDVYLTIETTRDRVAYGFVVRGRFDENGHTIYLDLASLQPIPRAVRVANTADEAVIVTRDQVITLYELNGSVPAADPRAQRFSRDLRPVGGLPVERLEYRVTSATPPDARGRLWVSNYYFPGDSSWVWPGTDPLRTGSTGPKRPVERLVQYSLGSNGLRRTGRVVTLDVDSSTGRNWEGIARLDHLGLLIVTDRWPRTILAFVPVHDP